MDSGARQWSIANWPEMAKIAVPGGLGPLRKTASPVDIRPRPLVGPEVLAD